MLVFFFSSSICDVLGLWFIYLRHFIILTNWILLHFYLFFLVSITFFHASLLIQLLKWTSLFGRKQMIMPKRERDLSDNDHIMTGPLPTILLICLVSIDSGTESPSWATMIFLLRSTPCSWVSNCQDVFVCHCLSLSIGKKVSSIAEIAYQKVAQPKWRASRGISAEHVKTESGLV